VPARTPLCQRRWVPPGRSRPGLAGWIACSPQSQVVAETREPALVVTGTEVLPRRGMPLKMIAPKAGRPNHSNGILLRSDSRPASHVLPTSRDVPAELAIVMDRWESLTPEAKCRIMAVIKDSHT